MEPSSTYYVYDQNQQVVQIRTKLMNHDRPLYIIQYSTPRTSSTERIRYRTEFVDETKFYS